MFFCCPLNGGLKGQQAYSLGQRPRKKNTNKFRSERAKASNNPCFCAYSASTLHALFPRALPWALSLLVFQTAV